MLTDQDYNTAATALNVEPAIIKAVAKIEGGLGFINGKLVILFESYQFYKMLKAAGIPADAMKQTYPDLITNRWVQNYGKQSEQCPKLIRAIAIDKEAAMKATSWGMFQPLGMYFGEMGYTSVMAMVADFEKGVAEQLTGFVKMVKHRGLDKALQAKDWVTFAKNYNGSGYLKNNYAVRLEQAYQSFL